MVNIDEVKNLCYKLAAKQTSAFPSPQEFNLYANMANIDLFNFYNDIRRKQLLKVRTGVEITTPDALIPFLTVDQAVTVYTTSNPATANLPNTLSDLLSVAYGSTFTNVGIVDYDKRNNTLNSTIDGPTATSPLVLRQASQLLVYPNTINILYITYLSFPATVTWAYTLNGNTPVYNAGASVQFQWDATEKINLVMRILKYMGISIREPELTQFAAQQEQLAN